MPKLKSTFDVCVKAFERSEYLFYLDTCLFNVERHMQSHIRESLGPSYAKQSALMRSLRQSIEKGEETLWGLKELERAVQELKTCIDYIAETQSKNVSPTELSQALGGQNTSHYSFLMASVLSSRDKRTLAIVNTIFTRTHEALDKLCKHVTKEYGPCNLKNTGYTQDAAAATLSESAKSGEATALSDSDAQNQSPDSYIAITDATETIPQNDVLKHTV